MTALVESTQGDGLLALAVVIVTGFLIFVVGLAISITRAYRHQVEPYTKRSIANDDDYVLALAWMDYNVQDTKEHEKMERMIMAYERRKEQKHGTKTSSKK